jgi:apolipoprotein N-acyltransferase
MNSRTRTVGRIGAGLGLAALSGILITLAFPPYNLWPLIWIGFVPGIVAQFRVMPARIGGLAYGVMIGGFFWGYFGPMFANTVGFMEWLPLFVGVIATALSNGDRLFHERTGYRWFVLHGAVVWVGIEALRGFLPVIGTGGFVAYALYDQPWLLQPVGLFSIYGLSLLVMVVNYALALGILALIDRRRRLDASGIRIRSGLARRWGIGVAAVLLAWVALSMSLLGQAAAPGPSIRVAAIQPEDSPTVELHVQNLIAQTRQAAGQGAQLVVWPEGALPFDPQVSHSAELRALVRETGVYLALGYGVHSVAGWRNEAVLIAPDGTFQGPYGKDHPVVWLGETSLTGGTYPTYETRLGTIGTIICYDLNFTDTARKITANGARLIAVPSNDWPGLAEKQYTNLALRAVENRVTLIKADSRYDSAVIDPTGRIANRAVSAQPLQTLVIADVPLGQGNAPLIYLGDWVGWLCIAGVGGFIVLARLAGRRAAKVGSVPAGPAPLPQTPGAA